jgi:hypothetical protein
MEIRNATAENFDVAFDYIEDMNFTAPRSARIALS